MPPAVEKEPGDSNAPAEEGKEGIKITTFQQFMENNEMRTAHFRLFKNELLSSLSGWGDLHQFVEKLEKRGIVLPKTVFENKDFDKGLELMWGVIRFNNWAMNELVKQASDKNDELLELIYKDISPLSLKYYVKYFARPKTGLKEDVVMDRITGTLEPESLCESLKAIEYSSMIEEVQSFLSKKKIDEASCYFMRSLPHIRKVAGDDSDWYFDFCEACLQDPYNRSIPQFVDPDYKDELEAYKLRCRLSKISAQPEASSGDADGADSKLPATVEETQESIRPCRSQEDYKSYRSFSDERLAGVPDPLPVELRPYQEELVETAERGVNTIICAPTGAGKTVVAAHIILEHFRSMKSKGKIARVAMMVPTIPLVEQQSTMMNKYLRKTFWLEGMSGNETFVEGRAPYVLASDLTVFTPQIFINLLKSVRKDDRLYFTDFTMFIFDECHHCDREHPYHVLMRMLHDFDGPKPQIVGLTASLPLGGSGGTPNVEAALDHMMELCARLSAHSISTVRKHVQNLQHYVTPPVDEVKTAHRPKYDSFISALQHSMTRMETSLKDELEKIRKNEIIKLRPDEIAFPSQQNSARYESFIGSLKNRLSELPGGIIKHQLIKMMEHLTYYYRALCMNDLLPDYYAYEYLKGRIENEIIPTELKEKSIQSQLCALFKKFVNPQELNITRDDNGEKKEIIKLLHDILRDQYRREPDSRTIIFVTTRMLAEKLALHLNLARVVSSGMRAVGFVTSSNQSSALSGQSAEEQRVAIENFNTGKVKVLVATSVAEEGLDISACNLIIKYNNTGSERSLIQRRGRARAKNSRSILLALDGSIEERELQNIQKEELMRRCLDHIQTKSEKQMREMVEAKIREAKSLREAAAVQISERRRLLEGKSYDLTCRLCGAFICRSNDIRVACDSQYVCCDPTIWSRIDAKVHKSSKVLSIAVLVGKPHCKGRAGSGCTQELGTIVKLYGAFLPLISAKAIVVEDSEESTGRSIQREKRWETITRDKFFVEPITERDLKLMLTSLFDYSKETHEEFEVQAQLAMEHAVEALKRERKQRVTLEE